MSKPLRTPMERAPSPQLGTAPIPKSRYTSAEYAELEHHVTRVDGGIEIEPCKDAEATACTT